jgi:hypothetical protein
MAALTAINLIEVAEPEVSVEKPPQPWPPITNGPATTANSATA